MKLAFSVILFLFLNFMSYGQKENYTYNIIHKDDTIGQLKAVKETHGKSVQYATKTNIETRILTKIEVSYAFDVTFNDQQLQQSAVKVYFNGRERTNTKTLKSNSGYKFYDSGELEKNIKQSVSYCAVQLIFEEPSGIDKVYSEETGAFHSLTKIASHSYSKENEKGRESIFHYKNGILHSAKIDAGIIEFELHLQQS